MAEAFPGIVPTTRSFTMGDYPSKTYRSLSGTVFKRAFGNKATGYTLDLTFKNIGDTVQLRTNSGSAKDILDHYNTCDGTFDTFNVTTEVFTGMGSDLESLIRLDDQSNIGWRYAEPPKVQSVKSGMSTVTVKLIGEIKV